MDRTSPRLTVAGLVIVLAVCSCSSSPPESDYPPLFDRVEEYRLDNGMLFLLLPRHDVPLVSGRVLVKVGNVDNPEGATGLAHMFEHMAFKGTDAIGVIDAAQERAVLDTITRRGAQLAELLGDGGVADSSRVASLRRELTALEVRAAEFVEPMAWPRTYEGYVTNFNAYTSQDITVYEADLPANHLEVWMLMESERLQVPVFREFYSELEVVKEERRSRTEDNPEGAAHELLKKLAFSRHPYRFPTIGYMEDLERLTPGMIRDFHARYYTPANMVGVLVGDFDPDVARNLIKRYFGDIESGPVPAGPQVVEPRPTAQRRGSHRQGEERRLEIAFPGLAVDDPRRPGADLLASVLARDKTSRLDRRLDFEAGVARSIRCSSDGWYLRYPGLFSITVSVMPEHTNEEAEALVWEVLQNLVTEPVTDARLDEIRRSYRRSFSFGLQKNADLAELLVERQAGAGWRDAYRRQARYERVTAAEVTELARELFRPELATVVYLEPAASEADNGGES